MTEAGEKQGEGTVEEVKKTILQKEKEIFRLEKRMKELRMEIPERTMWQKCWPYVLFFVCLCGVRFMNNWLPFYMGGELSVKGFGVVFLVLVGLDVWRDRRKQKQQAEIQTLRKRCDELQEEIFRLRIK